MVKKKFLKRCSILMCSVLVAANLVACGAGTGSTNEEVNRVRTVRTIWSRHP